MSKVSVIIPNYNRAAIIGETIHNMLSQSLKPHEVIVIDDGSTDDSISVIKSFGDKVILLQQINKGPGAARNAGIEIATGEFIQFMDSDDLASLNKLEVQVKALIDKEADIVYGPWLKAWMDNSEMRLEDIVLQQKALPVVREPLFWFLTSWSMVFQQCMVRKTVFDKIGSYREDIRFFEDGDLFVRILLAGSKLIFEPDSLTFYRLNDFGKLTGDGQINTGRAKAQGVFYQDMIKLAAAGKIPKKFIDHPEFIANVSVAVNDLYAGQVLDADAHRELIRLADDNRAFSKLRAFVKQMKAGLAQRIKGHRWPDSYQAGPLTDHQKELITQMGYHLIN